MLWQLDGSGKDCRKISVLETHHHHHNTKNACFHIFLQQPVSALLPDSLDHCFHFKVTPFSDFAGVLTSSWLKVTSEAALRSLGLPWWYVDGSPPAHLEEHGFDPRYGKIPHASEQPSVTTADPGHPRGHAPPPEKPPQQEAWTPQLEKAHTWQWRQSSQK